MVRLGLFLLLTPLLAGCAADQSGRSAADARQVARIAHALQGLTPGKPRSCIQQSRVNQVKTFKDTILYEYSPREIYRNDTSGGCTGLRYGDTIVSKTSGDQLCQGDIIHTISLSSRVPSGSCGLGAFIPYRR